MASFQKYFLAIVPDGELQEKATALKLELKDRFNIKYALKSPAHITLKMPFTYNEAKEDYLIERLQEFMIHYSPLELTIGGIDTFGNRVVFLKVKGNEDLFQLQTNLKTFCKRELKLNDELSDRNYHPHMTLAFKDLKKNPIPNIIKVLDSQPIFEKIVVRQLFLLKRANGRWFTHRSVDFGEKNK
ncbi:RNA 2',3'-cyclic phosphodiesterase [Algoriphagus lutimaris]|uniref:RNA 2',3'-cyclic phosphodiesterase n=1 Tax=Algoriphagus lutimaris TaxID=613197 RepID=UPI00196AA79D|nr:RNA 2',3'-cyclic phosphodiesterase [Algoriphagus lutimaris]MBN3521375.1 RNA 2',3'-cyclic phosphodiesterase [Algoriphagus lutimaris]